MPRDFEILTLFLELRARSQSPLSNLKPHYGVVRGVGFEPQSLALLQLVRTINLVALAV